LQGISSMEAANAFAPSFIADYNHRFAKPPRGSFDFRVIYDGSRP